MRKSCKHGLSLLLSLLLALSLMAVGASAEEFSDMPDGWSREAVSAAVENGLLQGSNGKLDPTGLLTRAQLATVIVRAFGATEEADLSGYTDVSADDWYYAALAKAKGMAVMNGTSGSTMSPDRPISRQEVFVILARALKLTDGKAEALNAYRDAGSVAAWAVGGTAAMVSAGYVGGSNGYLLPTDSITREQFAQLLYNIFGAYEQTAGVSTGNVTGSLLVNVPDVTVKNAKITGDLVVGDGVGDGDLTLENVSVGGRLVVRGGGVNSIHIKGSTIFSVVISRENGAVRVVADSSSKVEQIVIADGRDDVIIEGKVDTVAVETESVPVILKNARVNTLEVNGDKTELSLVGSTKVVTMNVAEDVQDVKLDREKSTSIGTIHADSDMSVSGEGSIGAVEGSGKLTDEKGDEVKPTARPTGGGGGGHTHSYAAEWTTDETYHWHAATCGHEDAKGSYGAHDYTTVISDTATCTDAGTRVMGCVCGKTVEQASPAKGHSFAETWSMDETEHWYASTCGHDVTDSKAPHDWNDGEITTPVGCTDNGVKTFTCKDCGKTKTEPIIANGHTPGDWTYGALGELEGKHYKKCTTCGDVTETAPHDWNDGEITTPVSCTDNGVKTYTCKDCGKTRTEPITALGHDFTNGETRYDADGHWHVCGRTGCTATDTKTPHSYDTTNCAQSANCDCGYVKPAGEHTWGAWSKVDDATHKHVCTACDTPETADHRWNDGVDTTPAKCTEAGVKTFTCKDCSATKTEPITALGHDFTNGETRYDADGHWHVCGRTDCTATDTKTPHSYGEDGKCVCGAEKPTAQPVAAPKGIVFMQQNGIGLTIRMVEPESTANIDHFLISFYEDGKKETSAATCGIDTDQTDFWIDHTKFDPAYNYNKVEITAYAVEGYANAVWTDDVSVTQTPLTRQTTWTCADSRLNVRFSAAAPGFYRIGVWNGDTLSTNSFNNADGLTVSRSVSETEAAAIAAGTATVKVDGWNVTQAEKVNGKWTVAFTSYSGTATREDHVAASAWSKDADSHWHACTNTGCTEKLDENAHDFDPTTGKCVCGLEKPTGDYLLVYTVKDGGLVISSNIPTTDGYYELAFSGDSASFGTSIFGSDYSSFALDSMFAGDPAVTYSKLEWKETVDNETATIAELNKRLTVGYSGTPINITGITLTDSKYNAGQWDAKLTTDAELDRSASYVVITKRGDDISASSTYFYDGAITSSFMKDSRYGDLGTATLYLVKVTAAVDDSGNATLTYTPLGDGYRYQLDANGISKPDDTPTNTCTLSYSEANGEGGLNLTFNAARPEAVGRQYLYFYNRDIGYHGERVYHGNEVYLGGTFAGTSAATYTGVRLVDIANDVEQTIAALDKSLTVAYDGNPISITKIDAVQNTEAGYSGSEVYFDLTLTTDTDLDGSASYVLFEVSDDGAAMGNIVYGSERCCELSTAYPAGETVTFYLMKVTGSVDEGGNATLTYTPMGDGYTWTVPSAS